MFGCVSRGAYPSQTIHTQPAIKFLGGGFFMHIHGWYGIIGVLALVAIASRVSVPLVTPAVNMLANNPTSQV
jgi:hypothetical protein